jgi:phage terminase Nu1 subunit (DNA packaging protein)
MPVAKSKDKSQTDQRIVNLQELATLLKISTTALSDKIRLNDDFPIEARGSNGVAYRFDFDKVKPWWDADLRKAKRAGKARRSQLQLWGQEVYGESEESPALLSPADRKLLAAAIRTEDHNRRVRGDLVERAVFDTKLTAALVRLRQELLEVPTICAKRLGLDRDQRIVLEDLITGRLDEMAAALGNIEAHNDPTERAA